MRFEQYLLTENNFEKLHGKVGDLLQLENAAGALRTTIARSDTTSTQSDDIAQAIQMLKEARRRCLRNSRLDYFAHYLSNKAEKLLENSLGREEFIRFKEGLKSDFNMYRPTASEMARVPKKDIFVSFLVDDDNVRKFIGIRIKKTNEQLIERKPSEGMPTLNIVPGSYLTLLAHCKSQSNVLIGVNEKISADEIAKGIAASLIDDEKTTPFTINLIACRAADGTPSFAEHLMRALCDNGVRHATIKASKTILAVEEAGTLNNADNERYVSKKHILDQKNIRGMMIKGK